MTSTRSPYRWSESKLAFIQLAIETLDSCRRSPRDHAQRSYDTASWFIGNVLEAYEACQPDDPLTLRYVLASWALWLGFVGDLDATEVLDDYEMERLFYLGHEIRTGFDAYANDEHDANDIEQLVNDIEQLASEPRGSP